MEKLHTEIGNQVKDQAKVYKKHYLCMTLRVTISYTNLPINRYKHITFKETLSQRPNKPY